MALHLAYLEIDTRANLDILAAANSLHERMWYWDTTNSRAIYATSNNTFFDPGDGGLVESFSNSNTIEFSNNGSGDFSFNAIIDPASNNILESSASGLKVLDISIAAGSSDYLSYNTATRELGVKQLLIISVTVDDNAASLAAWIAANYTVGDEKQEGDLLVLTDPDPTQVWIHNGGTAGTAADFTKVNTDHLDDAYIRTLFSAGDGLNYNSTTGEFEVDLSADAGNIISFGTDGGLFLGEDLLTGSADSGANNPIKYGSTLRILGGALLNVNFAGGSTPTFSIGFDTSTASAGDVATYNGSVVNWAAPAAGLDWWTEGRNNSAPNNTKHIHFWQPDSAETNVDIGLVPRGNGGFMLAIPDSAAGGGNKRGNYAVDLQLERNAANQVASGGNSTLLGGFGNMAAGTYSTALGGRVNVAGGAYTIAGGYASHATHAGSLILSDDRSSVFASTQTREARFQYENRFNVVSNLFETSGNAAFGNDSNAANVTIFSQASTNNALTLDHYGDAANNNKSEIRWSHQGTRRYGIGLDGSDIDLGGSDFMGNDLTLRSYNPDGTTVLNTIFKYKRAGASAGGSLIGLFTPSPLHAKVDIAGDLRVRTIDQDNTLEAVLVRDANGVIKRRAIGTFPGASGSSNIYNTSGSLDGNRTLDLDNFTLTFRNNADANVIQFAQSGSTINAILGDIEIHTADAGIILKSTNGTRYRITITNYGALQATAL